MALIAPMEDGMILSEQVVMLEATNEVEENKVAEELIITTGEDVGTSESKDMSKYMHEKGTTNISTMLCVLFCVLHQTP
mgnify:FL=1